jgi:hypothetical protein
MMAMRRIGIIGDRPIGGIERRPLQPDPKNPEPIAALLPR